MAWRNSRLAAVVVLALVAASCGGNDGATLETTAAPAQASVTTTAAQATTTGAPTTTTTTIPASTSTTSTVPPLDLAAVGFIEEWAATLNAGDHETAAEMLIAADEFDSPGDDETRTFFEIWVRLESQLAVDECRTLSSAITRCRITRNVEVSPHAPDPETSRVSVRFDDDGSLAYAGTEPIRTDAWFREYVRFQDWTLDTYGTRQDSPFTRLFGGEVLAEGYVELLAEQVAIWKEVTAG